MAQGFKDASLSVFNNNWSNVYDFSGDADQRNWTYFPENVDLSNIISLSYTSEDQELSSEIGNGDAKLVQSNIFLKDYNIGRIFFKVIYCIYIIILPIGLLLYYYSIIINIIIIIIGFLSKQNCT